MPPADPALRIVPSTALRICGARSQASGNQYAVYVLNSFKFKRLNSVRCTGDHCVGRVDRRIQLMRPCVLVRVELR